MLRKIKTFFIKGGVRGTLGSLLINKKLNVINRKIRKL